MIPDTMQAIEIKEFGPPGVLTLTQQAVPQPKENEILIQVRAAGVNHADLSQRKGFYPPPPGVSTVPGLEVAGEVVGLGSNVKNTMIGDRVTALIAGGGYAQYAVVDESNALPVPQGLSFVEAAAIPENYFTVWTNVFDLGQLKAGETFLVHGGSSGIGTAAIQLARLFGAQVIITAGSGKKCDFCIQLGANYAINYKENDFVAKVLEYTNNSGADVILDMVGGDYTNRNYKAAAVEGRIVQIAFMQGNMVSINLNHLLRKRLKHTGSGLRGREISFKGDIARSLKTHVWPLIEQKKINLVVDSVFKLKDASRAHEYMEASQHIGKIILEID